MSEAPPAPESPQHLLAQMEQLIAALNADLTQLDAALQAPLTGHATGVEDAPVSPLSPEADRG